MPKGENTRDLIIRKSAELFNQRGYDGCSLSDIMQATGLKKGGIYNHFKNKDEIALAAFDYSFGLVIRRFRQRLDQDNTSLDKLNSILAVFESYVYDPVIEGGCPVYNTAVNAAQHSQLKQRALEAYKMLHTYISIKIDEGKESGEFQAAVNSDEMATVLISSLDGAVVMSRLNHHLGAIETTIRFIREQIIQNMLVQTTLH
ncbi:MAG: TetR/AcrR family transcriptional regulator [Salibacteraceae bacterium]